MDKKEILIGLLEEIKPFENIDEDIELIDSGMLNSLELFELIALIEDEFDIVISGGDILPDNFKTIDNIIKLIEKLK